MSVREALNSKKGSSSKDQDVDANDCNDAAADDDDDDEAKFDARMRLQILRKRQELGDTGTRQKISNGNLYSSVINLIHLHVQNIFPASNMFFFI